jgi:hypothetical protein
MINASTAEHMDGTSGVLKLLTNIKVRKNIGSVSIEIVSYSIKNDLLKRTAYGNFELTEKAMGLLSGELSFDVI